MMRLTYVPAIVPGFLVGAGQAMAEQASTTAVQVTADNFPRAATDAAFANVIKDGGFGKFFHNRNVTLPGAGRRFMSMQVITEDEYTPRVIYKSGTYTFTKAQIVTRYVMMAVRRLVDPHNPADLEEVYRLQDAIKVRQANAGKFEVPDWDQASQKKVRDALLVLGSTLPDSKGMFGAKGQLDPVRYLIGSATAWGGNPEKDAVYLNVTPAKNDGSTIYRLRAKDVPMDAFWSISVCDAQGFCQKNDFDAYTLNSITAKRDAAHVINVQFGACDGKIANCLPITTGWNYMVRRYRPRAEILNGKWQFPKAVLAK